MPQLLIDAYIDNDVYKYTVKSNPDKLTQSDQLLMKKFGEPQINVGGTFGTGGDAYTLPDLYIRVISGLPYTQQFDSTTPPFDTDILTKTAAWLTAFESTYGDAWTTLRAMSDTFTNQTLLNI